MFYDGPPHFVEKADRLKTEAFSWRTLWILWAGLALVESVLLWNNAALDSYAWRSTRWFFGDQGKYTYQANAERLATQPGYAVGDDRAFFDRVTPWSNKLFKRTESIWRVLRTAGEPAFIAILAVGLLIFDQRRRWHSAAILIAASSSAGVISWLVRAVSGRYRPDLDGVNSWEWFRGFDLDRNRDLSFPSGHATAAMATAAVMAYFFPRGRVYFFVLGAACGFSRVVMQAHFYADVLLAGVLGWTLGSLITKWLYEWLRAMDERTGRRITSVGT